MNNKNMANRVGFFSSLVHSQWSDWDLSVEGGHWELEELLGVILTPALPKNDMVQIFNHL